MAKTKDKTTHIIDTRPEVRGIMIDLKGDIGLIKLTPDDARSLYAQLKNIFQPNYTLSTTEPNHGVYRIDMEY